MYCFGAKNKAVFSLIFVKKDEGICLDFCLTIFALSCIIDIYFLEVFAPDG